MAVNGEVRFIMGWLIQEATSARWAPRQQRTRRAPVTSLNPDVKFAHDAHM